ncbi:MAG: hypothetical protein FWD94_05985 [Treponema sp.]|nr:hypothetical protein [Treponema sp.]
MATFRPHLLLLCMYEVARFTFLVGAFLGSNLGGTTPFPLLPLITPGALFLLMSLFLLIDTPRYRAFCPLFLIGKALGIVVTLLWVVFIENIILIEFIGGTRHFPALVLMLFLVPGDALSMWSAARARKH